MRAIQHMELHLANIAAKLDDLSEALQLLLVHKENREAGE